MAQLCATSPGAYQLSWNDSSPKKFALSIISQIDGAVMVEQPLLRIDFFSHSAMLLSEFVKTKQWTAHQPRLIAVLMCCVMRHVYWLRDHLNCVPAVIFPEHILVLENGANFVLVGWEYLSCVKGDKLHISYPITFDNANRQFCSPEVRSIKTIPSTITDNSWQFSIASICLFYCDDKRIKKTDIKYTLYRWISDDPGLRCLR